MGIIPNTHKYVFNLCVEDFEIFDQKGYDSTQNSDLKIINVFDERSIFIQLEKFRRIYIQVTFNPFEA